jgi:hypothetical protein
MDMLPKEFPIPKDVDLSNLATTDDVNKAVQSIEMPKIKTVDVTPQLKAMEKRMSKRVVEFDVQYDPISHDINKIVVTEGNV